MELHPKAIFLFLIFTVLDVFLGSFWSPIQIGGVDAHLRFFYILIPLSIIFGWTVILGLTAGSLVRIFRGLTVTSLDPISIFLTVFGTFLASFLPMKIGRLKIGFGFNVVAILGALVALISLLFPWWSLSIGVLGQNLADFAVYPGWFGWDIGNFVEAIRRIAQIVVTDSFYEIMSPLELTLWLIGASVFLSLAGAFLRGRKGRGNIDAWYCCRFCRNSQFLQLSLSVDVIPTSSAFRLNPDNVGGNYIG